MSEMVERGIAALRTVRIGGVRERFTDEYAEAMVRAVIAAMREPTEEMVHMGLGYTEDSYFTAAACWRDMIDEALK